MRTINPGGLGGTPTYLHSIDQRGVSGLGTPALGSGVWAVLLGMSPELTGSVFTLVPELHSSDVRKRAESQASSI